MHSRKDDIAIYVLQRNAEKRIEIITVDDSLEEHIGRRAIELVGEDLKTILPRNIVEMIESYLVFGDPAQDLAAVLGKIRKFGLMHKKGREIRFSIKIVRDNNLDENTRFQLHLNRMKVMESLRQQLDLPKVEEKDMLDPIAGVPDRASFFRHLQVVNDAVAQGKVSACLSVLRVDSYAEIIRDHAQAGVKELFRSLVQVCLANLREDDILGYVAPNRVAVLLLETQKENAKIPLNRIRWMFAANPLQLGRDRIPVTLTATYFQLVGQGTPEAQVEECQRMLQEAEQNAGNTIIEPAR